MDAGQSLHSLGWERKQRDRKSPPSQAGEYTRKGNSLNHTQRWHDLRNEWTVSYCTSLHYPLM